MRSMLVALMLVVSASVRSLAADTPPTDPVLAEASDLAGAVMFIDSGAPGMVLVIVRGDRQVVLGYGETEKGNKHTPDGKSLLRLNSITKVFATEVLVSLAAEGNLRITDPLQRYAGDVKVPTFGSRPITLIDLATHSAGLPREMEGAPEGVNPRAWPTHADRWKWLPDYKLPWAPGTVASYSNVGFDLLADAIETAGRQVLSRTAARAGHRASWHGGHRLCADTRAVWSPHGRHRPRWRSYVCRYTCDRWQRRAL
jgi:D-alanyl-D-alanine-carboxypeptidase/D-alanyl-D-alanine-endopeptidase